MLTIVQDLLTNERTRPYLRNPREYAIRHIKGIVAHWTGNSDNGADAGAQVRFFNQTDRFTSAHYVVDDHQIRQCIPDHEIAFHVGGSRYKPEGDRIRETGLNPNYFLIGFEMCVNADGNWLQTYRHAVDLAAHLLHKYRFGIQNLYRHFDITGKDCPGMMLEIPQWKGFKRDVGNALALEQGKFFDSFPFARVKAPTGGMVHNGPGATFPIVDTLANGAFVEIQLRDNDWYCIAPHRFMSAGQLEILPSRMGEIVGTQILNVRSGPDTRFQIVRRLHIGDHVHVIEEQNGWFQIGHQEWVFKGFVR